MGPVSSKNEVNNFVKDIVSLTTDVVNSNITTASTVAAISLTGCSNVNLSNMTVAAQITVNSESIQKALDTQDATSAITSDISQKATSLAAGMNLTGTDATNVINKSTALATSIVNEVRQNCINSYLTSAQFTCNNSTYVNADSITINAIGDATNKCIQNSSSVQTAANDLTETIDQTAKATSISIWAIALAAIAAIVVLAVILKLGGGGSSAGGTKPPRGTGNIIGMMITMLIAVLSWYVFGMYYAHENDFDWFPYNKDMSDQNANVAWWIGLVSGLLNLALFVVFVMVR